MSIEYYNLGKNIAGDIPAQYVSKEKQDLAVLKYMAGRIRHILHLLEPPGETELPALYFLKERRAHTHRMVICRPQLLLTSSYLHFVGFVSGRQAALDHRIIEEIARADKTMLTELMHIPGMLSYSSLELQPQNWYNLVFLSDANVKRHFHTLEMHRYAAFQLAPSYYSWIRLHSGVMGAGLEGPDMCLLGTRHFHFPQERPFADGERVQV